VAHAIITKSVKILQVPAANVEHADLRQQIAFSFSPAMKS
jgi:hypothetical protein